MQAVRLILAQRPLAMLVCAATLLLRLVVPTGYMVSHDHGRVAIVLCSGTGPVTAMPAMPGMHGDAAGHGRSSDHGKVELPCAFSGLLAAALGPVDPIQLAALIAFVMTLAAGGVPSPSRRGPNRVRPPLRGPPLYL